MKMYSKDSWDKPWRNYARNKKSGWPELLGKLLIICIPVMIICLVANVMVRTEDTLEYSLKQSQILNSAPVIVDETQFVDLLSDYMQHKTNDFSLLEAVEYEPQDVFKDADRIMMNKWRWSMDILAILGILALAGTAVCYFFLIRWRKKVVLMSNFKKAAVVTIAFALLWAVLKASAPVRAATWFKLVGMKVDEGNLLYLVSSKGYFSQLTVFELIGTAAFLGVMAYLTWEIAGQRKMFIRRKPQIK